MARARGVPAPRVEWKPQVGSQEQRVCLLRREGPPRELQLGARQRREPLLGAVRWESPIRGEERPPVGGPPGERQLEAL